MDSLMDDQIFLGQVSLFTLITFIGRTNSSAAYFLYGFLFNSSAAYFLYGYGS